jgi:hypothetical protein
MPEKPTPWVSLTLAWICPAFLILGIGNVIAGRVAVGVTASVSAIIVGVLAQWMWETEQQLKQDR